MSLRVEAHEIMVPAFIESGTKAAFEVIGPSIVCSLVVGIFFGLVGIEMVQREGSRKERLLSLGNAYLRSVIYCACFALLGLVSGLLAGNSRTPAVGDLLPALFSMFGALSALFLAKDSSPHKLALGCALSLSLCILIGAFWGSHMREHARNSEQAMNERVRLFALCKLQELRARQLVEVATKLTYTGGIDFKCSDYPRD